MRVDHEVCPYREEKLGRHSLIVASLTTVSLNQLLIDLNQLLIDLNQLLIDLNQLLIDLN